MRVPSSLVIAVAFGAIACGDDAGLGPAGPAGPAGAYDEVGDFPTDGCGDGPSVASVELAGVWHYDLTFPGGYRTVAVMRLDAAADGLTGRMSGREAFVQVGDDGLLVRNVEQGFEGRAVVRAALACSVNDDGTLGGYYAFCDGEDCFLAFARFYAVPVLDDEVAEGVTARGELGWDDGHLTVNVQRRGQLAYVARYGDGLRIVDLADPDAPTEVGHVPVALPDEEIWNDVKLTEAGGRTYALVASNRRGVVAIDVTDPAAPAEVSSFPAAPVNVHTLALEGTRAYLADVSLGGLRVYDVADPAAPVDLGAFTDPGVDNGAFVHDLHVRDGQVYLGYWDLGMIVVDAAGLPGTPITEVGRFDAYDRRTSHSTWFTQAGGRSIVLHGDEDFDAHVRILDADAGSVAFLDVLAEFQTRPQVSVHNLVAVGDLGLVTYYQDGLRLLDLADPTAPVEIGHYGSWRGDEVGYGHSFFEGAIGVDFDDTRGLILLADTHRGLIVLEPSGAFARRVSQLRP